MLRALDGRLGLLTTTDPDHIRLVGFSAIVDGDRARLVPTGLMTRSTAIEQACRSRGVRLADEMTLTIDPTGPELLVAGLAEAAVSIPAWLAGPGRYRLESVTWSSDDVGDDDRPTMAATRLVSRIMERRHTTPNGSIRALAELRLLPTRVVASTLRGAALGDALVDG